MAGNWDELCVTRELLVSADSKRPMMGAMMDFAWYRRRCDAKIHWIARAMLRAGAASGGSGASRASHGLGGSFTASFTKPGSWGSELGARRAGDVSEEDVVQLAECIRRVLLSRKASPEEDTRTHVRYPPEPALQALMEWSPDELASFLSRMEGELAVRGKCKKYAGLLRAARVSGSQVDILTHGDLAEMGVPVGDRLPLLKMLRILGRCLVEHQEAAELRVSVLR